MSIAEPSAPTFEANGDVRVPLFVLPRALGSLHGGFREKVV